MARDLSLICVLACLSAAAVAEDALLWVEGEQPLKKQLVVNPGLNDVNPDELSGGAWICSFSHEKEPTGTAGSPSLPMATHSTRRGPPGTTWARSS